MASAVAGDATPASFLSPELSRLLEGARAARARHAPARPHTAEEVALRDARASIAELGAVPPPLLERVYARWRRHCAAQTFRFRPDLAHACWADDAAKLVCFSPLLNFYGCLTCGRAHQCEGQWESCFSVRDPSGSVYVCAFSGAVIDTEHALGSFAAEIEFDANARHPEAHAGTSISGMIKSGSGALARAGIMVARLQRQDTRQEKRNLKRTRDETGSGTDDTDLGSSSATISPEHVVATVVTPENAKRRRKLDGALVASALEGAERDYAASTTNPSGASTKDLVAAPVAAAEDEDAPGAMPEQGERVPGLDTWGGRGDEDRGDEDDDDGGSSKSLDSESSYRFNLALMRRPHNFPAMPTELPAGFALTTRAGVRMRRLMTAVYRHDPFAHMESELRAFDKRHREPSAAETPGSAWTTALLATRAVSEAPMGVSPLPVPVASLAPVVPQRVTAQAYRQSVHQGMRRIHADVLDVVTALAPYNGLERTDIYARTEAYSQLALRLFRFMITLDPLHAPIRHRRIGVVLLLHLLPENFIMLDYYMAGEQGEQNKTLVWEADPWLAELRRAGWLSALVGDLKRGTDSSASAAGLGASGARRRKSHQPRKISDDHAPKLPSPLFHRTDVTTWHNAEQAFFRAAHVTAGALRAVLFS
jgi:hypothetical protein